MKAEEFIEDIKPFIEECVELVNRDNDAEIIGTLTMLSKKVSFSSNQDELVEATMKSTFLAKLLNDTGKEIAQ